ncbi:MAG: hypothetical protein ACK5X3_02245 [Pseudomonadota bacterium]|jgi:hypothetical protein
MVVAVRPVNPDLPFPLSEILRDLSNVAAEVQTPTQPVALASVAFASLPPAANWPGCMIHVTDRNSIAISTPVAGVYTWLRADGSAL